MKKIIFLVSATLVLSSCAAVDSQINTDNKVQQKAAFALGVKPDQVQVKDRKNEFTTVRFTALSKGKEYQCYYTTGGFIASDAICSGTDGTPANASCNALLKAAGKCGS